MLPVLQAEETLDRATAAGLGGGTFSKSDHWRIYGALQRQANHGRAHKLDVTGADAAVLAAMGIAVEVV